MQRGGMHQSTPPSGVLVTTAVLAASGVRILVTITMSGMGAAVATMQSRRTVEPIVVKKRIVFLFY